MNINGGLFKISFFIVYFFQVNGIYHNFYFNYIYRYLFLTKVFGLSSNKKEIRKILMIELNKEITDSINFDEFTNIMVTRIGERESKENLENIFRMFDGEGKGGIGVNDLIRISKEIGNIFYNNKIYLL